MRTGRITQTQVNQCSRLAAAFVNQQAMQVATLADCQLLLLQSMLEVRDLETGGCGCGSAPLQSDMAPCTPVGRCNTESALRTK